MCIVPPLLMRLKLKLPRLIILKFSISDLFQRVDGDKGPIWWVFSGMGSQWNGMGSQLMHIPLFRDVIDKCDEILRPRGVDIKHILTTDDETIFDNILHSFVGIAAIQVRFKNYRVV